MPCALTKLHCEDWRHDNEFLRHFPCTFGAKVQSLPMSDRNMAPTPVRFPGEIMARVDAVAKSLALSHAAVMRLAINQWFEAGGDKNGVFTPAKKGADKAASKGRKKSTN